MMKYFLSSPFHLSSISGPHYHDNDDIDKSGNIFLWKLSFNSFAMPCPDGRPFKIYPAFISPVSPSSKYQVFGRLYQLELLPTFHQQPHWNIPLRMNKWFSYLGKTSFCHDFNIYNGYTDVPIARGVYHCVCVNWETKRPASVKMLNAHIYEELGADLLTRKKVPSGFVQPDQPDDAFIQTILVTSSTIDSNQHHNMFLYIQDCWNAACSAACARALPHFDKELDHFKVKKVTTLAFGEALVGDSLDIACWEHPEDSHIICFTITKDSMLIFQCQIELYPLDQAECQPKVAKLSKL